MIKWRAKKRSFLVEDKPTYFVEFDISCWEEDIIEFYNDIIILSNQKEDFMDILKLKSLVENYSSINEYWDV